jgi:hypothetical protein
MVNAGYEGYDAVMQKVEDVGGKDLREKVEKFMGLLNKVINGAIILGMIGLRSRGIPGLGGNRGGPPRSRITRGHDTRRQFGDRFRDRGRRTPSRGSSSSVGRSGGRSMVTSNLSGAPGRFGRSAFTNMSRKALMRLLGRKGTRVLLGITRKVISPIVKKIPIVGALIDFLMNYFIFKEPLGKSAFVAAASGLGTLVGGAIGSLVPFAGTLLGGLAGGVMGDMAGRALYDAIFGDQHPQEPKDIDEYDLDESVYRGKIYILKEQVITN